jgi:hypothetical protein
MLALASIGKLKMVKDFPLPVRAEEPPDCGRNLCTATCGAITSALSVGYLLENIASATARRST